MTYKTAQTVGKKNAAQHRKPNTTLNTASRPVQVRRRHFRYLNINFANFSTKSI